MSVQIPAEANPDITQERKQVSFNPTELAHILYGSKEKFERRQELAKLVASDPVYSNQSKIFLSREEEYSRAFVMNSHLIRKVKELGLSPEDAVTYFDALGELAPLSGLHHSMFIPTIQSQGTPEQQQKWLPLALNYKIIGTYAQTEAGHGTFLRGIETTATFDPEKDEFVLNTPTLTSMKWWPGSLGKTATHCILMARLIIKGKDHGVHPFIMQIRSLEDHKLLPGIESGDIGRKMGWNSIDNGFLKLNQVRISRDQLLMKYAKVDREGNYTKPPHAKIAYGTMMYVRANMVDDAYRGLSKAVTIVTRYSVVRRQGYGMGVGRKAEATTPEWKILDYGLQRYSVLPLIASSYALKFASHYMLDLYHELQADIKKGDFSGLAEVHATSSGLKAFSTLLSVNGAEECRRRCGGHGFLRSSGLPDIVHNITPSLTYEGEFQPLLQQTVRYLFRALHQLKTTGTKVKGNADYINDVPNLSSQVLKVRSMEDLLDSRIQMEIYRHKAARLLANASERLEAELSNSKPWAEAWNYIQPDMISLVKAHVFLIYLKGYIRTIEKQPNQSAPHIIGLTKLKNLFALYHLEQDLADVLVDGYMNTEQVEMLKKQVRNLLNAIRPDAIGFVDAFSHTDHALNSALGRYDGNVYHALYEKALEEPLNKQEVLPTYKYIRPFIQSKL